MATEQTLNQVATAFINVFDTLEADSHVALRVANCMHTFAPSSVNPPPPMTNQDWANHLGKLQLIMTGFPITPKEIHVNVTKSQVVIWATAIPKCKEEVKRLKEGDDGKEWNYVGEFMFILNVDEESKISRIVDFLDSLGTDRARGLMIRAWDNVGASQGLFEAMESS
ncbi:hypothetical protein FSARC_4813 [Fusarium sarcochroum]|uniref:Uncharacterized protein n=1 Tax=Fusarium sarcochroum TaxID=1208366 RepID=A0A8H4U0U9_9HYPO|nr:hypothetical protein FSARC_4813 [Fusarium sarcochroum]